MAVNNRLVTLQNLVATKVDDLQKMVGYTLSLSEVIKNTVNKDKKADIDLYMIRVTFYESILRDFLWEITTFGDEITRKAEAQEDNDIPSKESLRLTLLQIDQMKAEADQSLSLLEEMKDALGGLDDAYEQKDYVEKVSSLREFQEKIKRGAG